MLLAHMVKTTGPFQIIVEHAYACNALSGGHAIQNAIDDPAEVVATIYHSLGFDIESHLPGPAGRPFPLVDFGKREIRELF